MENIRPQHFHLSKYMFDYNDTAKIVYDEISILSKDKYSTTKMGKLTTKFVFI